MKHLIILLVAAAAVGIVISRIQTRPAPTQAPQEGSKVLQSADATPPAAPAQSVQAGLSEPELSARVVPRAGGAGTGAQEGTAARGEGSRADAREAPPAEHAVTAAPPGPATAPEDALTRAKALLAHGKRLEARKLLSRLYRDGSASQREGALALLNEINRELVFNPRCFEGASVHVVKAGENPTTIARQYGVSAELILRLNGIEDPRRLRIGQRLKVLPGRRELLVDKSDFRLALFIDGQFIKEYRVGIGKDERTPAGEFTIEEKLVEPDWYPPEGGVIHYGEPGHLIGDRWMGFADRPGATGLGIHGTIDPASIGTKSSNGCIRLHNGEMRELYDLTTVGTRVIVQE